MLIGLRHTSAVDSFQVEKVKQKFDFFRKFEPCRSLGVFCSPFWLLTS